MPSQKLLGWMSAFEDMRDPTGFFQRLFILRRGNVFDGEEVEVDIRRNGEKVAIPAASGTRMNDKTRFTNKKFKPPRYSEGMPLSSDDFLNRDFGSNPYSQESAGYARRIAAKLMDNAAVLDGIMGRAIELQAAKVLQYGALTLKDEDDNTVFDIDYSAKASHFPTVGTGWNVSGSDPYADIGALAEEMRKDGNVDATDMVMSRESFADFERNEVVQKLMDLRRLNAGEINAIGFNARNSGAQLVGEVIIDGQPIRIWLYNGYYTDPVSGLTTRYLEQNKTILFSEASRFDKVCARVPGPIVSNPQLARFMPGRMTNMEAGYDVTPNIYASESGEEVVQKLETRTLCVPTGIDQFGCMTTRP